MSHTQKGESALMYACDIGSVDIVQLFLKHPKVDVNGKRDVNS